MSELPAVCGNCDEVYPSGIMVEESGGVIVIGDRATRSAPNSCPYCGGPGRITARSYGEAATATVLRSAKQREELNSLIVLLNEVVENELDQSEALNRIERRTPQFAGLKALLPANTGELYAMLALIVSVATLLHDFYSAVKSKEEDAKLIREIVRQAVQETQSTTSATSPAKPQEKLDKGSADSEEIQWPTPVQRHYLWTAQEAERRGDYRVAIGLYSKMLKSDPDYHIALCYRGWAYYQLGWLTLALADLTRAIELKHDDHRSLGLRGAVNRRRRRYTAALIDLNRALNLRPSDEWSLVQRARVHRDQGRYDMALKDLNLALHINPSYGFALNERRVLQRNKRRSATRSPPMAGLSGGVRDDSEPRAPE
jgi:tetratricopeptide (TPR) repeat protein